MNRILILDIDGVLITTPTWKPDHLHHDGYSDFNSKCVDNLNALFDFDNFEIWLSSSRRSAKTLPEFNLIFEARGIKKKIIGYLPEHPCRMSRKEEIEKFIIENDITRFLIIDDDKSLNNLEDEIKKWWIKTDLMLGFDLNKLSESRRILNLT